VTFDNPRPLAEYQSIDRRWLGPLCRLRGHDWEPWDRWHGLGTVFMGRACRRCGRWQRGSYEAGTT
jgi:hypothetical protein